MWLPECGAQEFPLTVEMQIGKATAEVRQASDQKTVRWPEDLTVQIPQIYSILLKKRAHKVDEKTYNNFILSTLLYP